MPTLRHRLHRLDGIRLHTAEAGSGPLVLFVHGFPESWYSWRHQLPVVAAAGYRAVAVDVRGYGRSSKPLAVDAYRMLLLVADMVELVAALGESRAVIVGHDWGSPIAWNTALLRPDVFRALATLSVPYAPRGPQRPSAAFRQLAGENEFYVEYFQEPGRAEREIERDIRSWLLGFVFSASGDAPPDQENISLVPPGREMRQRFTMPDTLPDWFNEEDLAFYSAEFEHGGLRGPLNRYRNMDRDWEDFAAFAGMPIQVPALFVGGDRDGPTIWGQPAIERFGETLPRLHRSEILPGCGHWTQQERPDEVNQLLLDFLGAVEGESS